MTVFRTAFPQIARPGYRTLALSSTILITLLAAPAQADTLTWDAGNGGPGTPAGADGTWEEGGGTTLWQDLPNAQDDEDFTAGDDAIFGGPAPYTVDISGDVNAQDVTFDVDGVEVTDADGADTLNIAGTVAVTNTGDAATISADIGTDASVMGEGDLTLAGEVAGTVVSNGTGTTTITDMVGALDNNTGTTDVTTGGTVTGTTSVSGGEVTVTGGTLTGDTTVSGGTLDIDSGTAGAVENSGGTVEIAGGTLGSLDNTAGTGTLEGGEITGDLNVDAGEVTNSGTTVTGETTVTGGDLNLTGGTLTGDTTVSGGTLDIDSGTAGAVENSGGTVEIAGGTLGSLDNTAGSADMTGGTVTGDVNIDSGDVTTSAGTIQGDVTQNGGTLDLGNQVQGDVTVSAGALDLQSGAVVDGTLTNDSTTVFDDGTLNDVINTGTMTIAGDQTITGSFDNSGTIDGTTPGDDSITTGGPFTTSGDITTEDGGTFTVTSDAITLENGATFNGTNDLDGAVILDGAVTSEADLDVIGDITLTDALTNQATGVLDITATLDMDGNDITNDGAVLNVDTGGSLVNGGTLTNQNGGQLGIDATTDVTVSAATNTGTDSVMTVDGVLSTAGGLNNQNGGQVIVSTTGDVDGQITNTADLDLNGGTIGSLDNNAGGDVDVTGGAIVDTRVTNAGTLDVASGTLDITDDIMVNQNGGTLTLAEDAELDANIDNQNGAEAIIAGTVTGSVRNSTGGTLTTDGGTGSISEAIANNGTFNITDGSTLTATGGTTNIANGVLDVSGTLISNVRNAGTLTLSDAAGQITGALVSNGTIAIEDGEALNVTGGTTITDGTANISGNLTGDLRVNSGGTLTTSATTVLGSGTETILNNGSNNFTLNGFVNGTLVTRAGASTRLGNGARIGTLNSTGGALILADGAVDTTVTVNNDAAFAGTISFDVDLSDGSAAGDRIDVGGSISGTNVGLDFTNLAGADIAGDIDGITLITYGGDSTLTFGQLSGLPQFGAFEYFVDDDGAGNITLEGQVNSGVASLAATVGLTQTIVGAIINRPTSPFVADLAIDPGASPCGAGAWARVTGGEADAEGTFRDVTRGSGGTTPVNLSYAGFQAGGDFACFDNRFNGFDMAFGAIVGYNEGDSSNQVRTLNPTTGEATGPVGSITDTDFSQKYAGIYATASRGRFFADLQYRYEIIDFESTNTEIIPGAGFDLDGSTYDSTGSTLSGAFGYSWPLGGIEGLNFVGSVGFSYSDFETDDIDLGADGTLELGDGTTKLGFISGTLSRTRLQPDDVSLINYFATATYYNDFASDPSAIYVDAEGGRNPIALSNLGSYGEISAGINYVRLLNPGSDGTPRQLNAAIRIDGRKGQNVDSWGITGQVRIQF